DLDEDFEAGQPVRGEDEVGAERHLALADADHRAAYGEAGGEPALLVELAVVGQVRFGHRAEQLAVGDRQRAVVDPPVVAQRRADQQHRAEALARRDDLADRGFRGVEERRLQVQVVDRVGRDAQLGIDQQVDVRGVGAAGFGDDPVAVEGDVRGAHGRRAGGHADEAVAVHRVERMRLPCGGSGDVLGRQQPVLGLAYAELRQTSLRRRARDLAFGFPAVDRPAGPWSRRAVTLAELAGRKGGDVRLAPGADLLAGFMHTVTYP